MPSASGLKLSRKVEISEISQVGADVTSVFNEHVEPRWIQSAMNVPTRNLGCLQPSLLCRLESSTMSLLQMLICHLVNQL